MVSFSPGYPPLNASQGYLKFIDLITIETSKHLVPYAVRSGSSLLHLFKTCIIVAKWYVPSSAHIFRLRLQGAHQIKAFSLCSQDDMLRLYFMFMVDYMLSSVFHILVEFSTYTYSCGAYSGVSSGGSQTWANMFASQSFFAQVCTTSKD